MIEGLPADELIWIDENGGLWDKDGGVLRVVS